MKAMLFDLGNTLWHMPEMPPIDKVRHETVSRILNLLRSWGMEPQERHRFLGRDIRLAITEADRVAYEGDCVSPDFVAIVRGVADDHGMKLSHERAEQLWHAWNLEGGFFGRRLFDDALDTLFALRARGYRTACVTNRVFGGPGFVDEVDGHGLTPLFDAMSVSCEVGYMKPHRALFEHALDVIGVAAEDAVMVGDSLKADVAGSQALGMTAIWRRPRRVREEIEGVRPDYIIDELGEVLALPIFQTGA